MLWWLGLSGLFDVYKNKNIPKFANAYHFCCLINSRPLMKSLILGGKHNIRSQLQEFRNQTFRRSSRISGATRQQLRLFDNKIDVLLWFQIHPKTALQTEYGFTCFSKIFHIKISGFLQSLRK